MLDISKRMLNFPKSMREVLSSAGGIFTILSQLSIKSLNHLLITQIKILFQSLT